MLLKLKRELLRIFEIKVLLKVIYFMKMEFI